MRTLKAIGAAPRRTLRVALWSTEEGGLRGSRAYVAEHFGNPRDGIKADYENLSVYFNMDNGTGRVRGIHQQGNPFVAPIFEAWLKPFHDLKAGTLSNFSNRGSDQLAFDEAGLPGFQILQDRIDYRTRTHHTNMDVFDKRTYSAQAFHGLAAAVRDCARGAFRRRLHLHQCNRRL